MKWAEYIYAQPRFVNIFYATHNNPKYSIYNPHHKRSLKIEILRPENQYS